jgi:hypothetical protein
MNLMLSPEDRPQQAQPKSRLFFDGRLGVLLADVVLFGDALCSPQSKRLFFQRTPDNCTTMALSLLRTSIRSTGLRSAACVASTRSVGTATNTFVRQKATLPDLPCEPFCRSTGIANDGQTTMARSNPLSPARSWSCITPNITTPT